MARPSVQHLFSVHFTFHIQMFVLTGTFPYPLYPVYTYGIVWNSYIGICSYCEIRPSVNMRSASNWNLHLFKYIQDSLSQLMIWKVNSAPITARQSEQLHLKRESAVRMKQCLKVSTIHNYSPVKKCFFQIFIIQSIPPTSHIVSLRLALLL